MPIGPIRICTEWRLTGRFWLRVGWFGVVVDVEEERDTGHAKYTGQEFTGTQRRRRRARAVDMSRIYEVCDGASLRTSLFEPPAPSVAATPGSPPLGNPFGPVPPKK